MRHGEEVEQLSLNDATSHVLEECRTVVPGMQALFGFQLMAVFSSEFKNELSSRPLMASMAPLAIGICLDVYLVARATIGSAGIARHRDSRARCFSGVLAGAAARRPKSRERGPLVAPSDFASSPGPTFACIAMG
jgi:hypothetical protein